MTKQLKVLFSGEGIYQDTTIYKGWDLFHIGEYMEHGGHFIKALETHGMQVDYIPTQRAAEEFPFTVEELQEYNAVILSDVGANTLLMCDRTRKGIKTPNRLRVLEQYVANGGGFIMWGGYLSFTGLHGKGFYKDTPIETLLPVNLMERDDRRETPEGFLPVLDKKDHPIFNNMPDKWEGWFMSYNRLIAKDGATVLAHIEEYDNDPFLVVWEYQKGRSLASAVDCAHHGAAPSFLDWKYSSTYFANAVKWVAKSI